MSKYLPCSTNASSNLWPRTLGCLQGVRYYDLVTNTFSTRIHSIWILRVQGETEGNFRGGDQGYAPSVLGPNWHLLEFCFCRSGRSGCGTYWDGQGESRLAYLSIAGFEPDQSICFQVPAIAQEVCIPPPY